MDAQDVRRSPPRGSPGRLRRDPGWTTRALTRSRCNTARISLGQVDIRFAIVKNHEAVTVSMTLHGAFDFGSTRHWIDWIF